MGYLTAKQFSEKWGITERRIIKLCSDNRINGAIKNGMVWLIPEDTIKPSDRRNKISQYINTQKRIMIANINNQIGYYLIPLLKKEGYIVEGLYKQDSQIDIEKLDNTKAWEINYEDKQDIENLLSKIEKYYEEFIYIDIEKATTKEFENKAWFICKFAKKMHCDSSVTLVNVLQNLEINLESILKNRLQEEIGLRINAINISVPLQDNILIYYDEIAQDVVGLLTNFKNTTGISISTDGGYLEFEQNGRTKPLETGKFYKVLNNYFKRLNKQSYMWSASTMMQDEWTDEPLEMNFRVNNLDAANRGASIERIFIFSKSKIEKFKENKTLKIYMQSNIKTMFVDYDEIKSKEPELLKIVGDGWDGIDKDTLIVDLPVGNKQRGYISINKDEIQKAYECFEKLKTYAKDLKEVLK